MRVAVRAMTNVVLAFPLPAHPASSPEPLDLLAIGTAAHKKYTMDGKRTPWYRVQQHNTAVQRSAEVRSARKRLFVHAPLGYKKKNENINHG